MSPCALQAYHKAFVSAPHGYGNQIVITATNHIVVSMIPELEGFPSAVDLRALHWRRWFQVDRRASTQS